MMSNIEQKHVRGGVLANTPKNAVEIGFSGWKEWADESEHGIKTYTSLEQMGLSDVDMSPDDFAANIKKIDLVRGPFIFDLKLNSDLSNIAKSVKAKLLNDLGYNVNFGSQDYLKIEHYSVGSHDPIKMELYGSAGVLRQKSIVCYADRDGNTMNVYPFREVAYIGTLDTTKIELLNGWEKHPSGMQINRNGNYVFMNFIIDKGIRDGYTKLFKLPSNFAPKVDIAIPVICWSQAKHKHVNGLLTVSRMGEVSIRFIDSDSDGVMICASGFSIE